MRPAMPACKPRRVMLISHPPYSPDLALCNFWLFPSLKDHLTESSFDDPNEVKMAVDGFFQSIPKDDFVKTFDKWVYHWEKCLEVRGDYVEES